MVKKGDFIRVEYTGYDESGSVFDSTSGDIAKELHGKEGSMLLVFGVDFIVQGMEEALLSMKKGEEREFTVPVEKAFGKRSPSKMKIFSINEFHAREIDPYPGAIIQLETDGGAVNGLVKSVNSGRVLMDFNHPLADQAIKYKLKITDVLEDAQGKISELLKDLQIEGTVAIEGGKATVTMKKGQPEADVKKTQLTIAIKSTISEIKDISFKEE